MRNIFFYLITIICVTINLNSKQLIRTNLYDYAPNERLWDKSFVFDYLEGNKLFVYTTVKLNEPNKLKILIINSLGDSVKFLNSDKNIIINDVLVESNGNIKIVGNFIVKDTFGMITHVALTYLELDKKLNFTKEITTEPQPTYYISERYTFSHDGTEILETEYISTDKNLYMNRYDLNLDLINSRAINYSPLIFAGYITTQLIRMNDNFLVVLNERLGQMPFSYTTLHLLKIDNSFKPMSLKRFGDTLISAEFININRNGAFLIKYNEANLKIYKKTFLTAYDSDFKAMYTTDTLNVSSQTSTHFQSASILNDGSMVMMHQRNPDLQNYIRRYDKNGNTDYEFFLMSTVTDTAALDFTGLHGTQDDLIYLTAQYAYRGYKWDSKQQFAYFKVALYVIGDPSSIEANKTDFAQKLHIYPNPTTDFINIVPPAKCHHSNHQIDIYNLLGDKVLSVNNYEGPTLKVDVSKLNIGTYLIKCGSCVESFIKLE